MLGAPWVLCVQSDRLSRVTSDILFGPDSTVVDLMSSVTYALDQTVLFRPMVFIGR